MSYNLTFVLLFTVSGFTYLVWGFKNLQREDMQVAAAIPMRKSIGGHWEGINFTYYGVFTANAVAISITVFLILTAGAGIPVSESSLIIAVIMAVSMPASKIIAWLVEKKTSTFTAGGGSFAGFLITPPVVYIVNETLGRHLGNVVPLMTVLAAISITYCIGEGLGRLACISFGCCYGKPLESCSPVVRKIFNRFSFVFTGKTKKISYAHGWDGRKMLPIQGITAVFNTSTAVVGMLLYVNSQFSAAFLSTMILSQGWRIASEFVRSDYRGGKSFSDYQTMCALSILLAVALSVVSVRPTAVSIDLFSGIKAVVELSVILFLQIIWISTALYLGKSKVTASRISIFVREDNV